MDWVYGYRWRDKSGGCNLYSLPATGEICYSVAATVVVYNAADHSQRHYMGHTNDVECLAVHPDKQVGTDNEELSKLIFMELNDAWSDFDKGS